MEGFSLLRVGFINASRLCIISCGSHCSALYTVSSFGQCLRHLGKAAMKWLNLAQVGAVQCRSDEDSFVDSPSRLKKENMPLPPRLRIDSPPVVRLKYPSF